MFSSFLKNITISILLIYILSGCSTGVMGETVIGNPGSPVWFNSAKPETIIFHYKKNCKAYGFTEGSTQLANCIQNSINSGRQQAEVRKMNSLKILENMDKMERDRYPSNRSITCTQQGVFTNCNY